MRLPAVDALICFAERTEATFYRFYKLVNRSLLLFAGMPADNAFPAEFGHHAIFFGNYTFVHGFDLLQRFLLFSVSAEMLIISE